MLKGRSRPDSLHLTGGLLYGEAMSDFRLEYLQYENEKKLHARKMELIERVEKALLERINDKQWRNLMDKAELRFIDGDYYVTQGDKKVAVERLTEFQVKDVGTLYNIPDEDMHRIIACVNACAGVPTEVLVEHGVVPAATATEYYKAFCEHMERRCFANPDPPGQEQEVDE